MRETPLHQLKTQMIWALKNEISLQAQHLQEYQAIKQSLLKTQELQKNYQQKLLQEIELLQQELNNKNEMLQSYQQKLSKEIISTELDNILVNLEPELLTVLSNYLGGPNLQKLIQEEIQKAIQPHMSSFRQLDSIDWSNIQDVFSLQKSLQLILDDFKNMNDRLNKLLN